jgi:hypothetical protein
MFRPSQALAIRPCHEFLQQQCEVPLLIAANLERGGNGTVSESTEFASPMQVAATDDDEMAYRLGLVCGRGVYAMGCNRSFSPVVDIDFIFQNPITITRTYGSDPERVARMSRAYMKGLEESGIVLIGATERAFSASALFGTIFALGADTIEYGEWKSGVRTEGLISAAVSASTKLGAGMGIVLIGWVLGMCGYVGGAAAPSASAIAAIKALFLYVPLGQFVLQIALLWFYRLDGEYPEIVRELRARSAPQAIN